jgi:hypothetical protein
LIHFVIPSGRVFKVMVFENGFTSQFVLQNTGVVEGWKVLKCPKKHKYFKVAERTAIVCRTYDLFILLYDRNQYYTDLSARQTAVCKVNFQELSELILANFWVHFVLFMFLLMSFDF